MNQNRLWIFYPHGIVAVAALLALTGTVFLANGTAYGADDAIRFAQHTAKAAGPAAGLKPLDDQGRMHISNGDRCPVCAMNVRDHSKFASAIQLKNGTTHYFCGTGCMIRSWMHPDMFLGAHKDMLETPVVRDYFTGTEMDARDALWVAGSDIVGPMGPALVPLRSQGDLETFVKRHGGKAFFRLSEMDPEKWQTITGKRSAPKSDGFSPTDGIAMERSDPRC